MINILHVSDIHAEKSNITEINAKVERLVSHVKEMGMEPNVLVVSGDIAYSGKPSEYELAWKHFFEVIKQRLKIPDRKIVIVPGNHDVDRALIDLSVDTGLKTILAEEEPFRGHEFEETSALKRLGGYFGFSKKYLDRKRALFDYRKINVSGVSIGFAELNSAWLCRDDEDRGKLHLTKKQIRDAAEKMVDCDLKIAVVHHPLDWYSSNEEEALADLQKEFSIVLTGHIHKQSSSVTVTPSSNCCVLTTKALFDGKDEYEGFSLYSIDPRNATLDAYFRRYIKGRREYDKDTGHAKDGYMRYQVSCLSFLGPNIALAQKCVAATSKLADELHSELKVFQQLVEPIIVSPRIVKGSRKPHGKSQPVPVELKEIAKSDSILYGSSEAGKSVALRKLANDHNSVRHASDSKFAVYLDLKGRSGINSEEELIRIIKEESSLDDSAFTKNVWLIVDHLENQPTAFTALLFSATRKWNWQLTLSLGGGFFKTSIAVSEEFHKFELFEIGEWGPSHIRQFLAKLYEGKDIDLDSAFAFVRNSLSETDLPASPVTVTLYGSMFPKLGDKISSLAFVRLLEQIEQKKLSSTETDPESSFYNRREVCMRLAAAIWANRGEGVEKTKFSDQIQTYFDKKHLVVNVDQIILELTAAAVFEVRSGLLVFALFVYYDYYLAKALELRIKDIGSIDTIEVAELIRVADALAIYSGFARDDQNLAQRLLSRVGELFGDGEPGGLDDLDLHIKNSLLPRHRDTDVDSVASGHINEKVDYEESDPEFRENRKDYLQKRRRPISEILKRNGDEIDKLGLKVDALKAFYRVFRNLEHLDGDTKTDYLDKLLSMHIKANFDMIAFYGKIFKDENFKTAAAYLVTLAGQTFLASNIGNQTLATSVRKAYNEADQDFKKLLLLLLYADLKQGDYIELVEEYVSDVKSAAAIEMIYIKATIILITYEEDSIPVSLLSMFRKVFKRRNEIFGEKNALNGFESVVGKIKAGRSVLLREAFRKTDKSGESPPPEYN